MPTRYTALRDRCVLVVDNSPAITALVTETLRACGARVTAAHTARDALALAARTPFDLLLLEPRLSDACGHDVLQALAGIDPDLARNTIVLTAGRYDRPALQALADRGHRVLFKPFLLDDLRTAVLETLLGRDDQAAA